MFLLFSGMFPHHLTSYFSVFIYLSVFKSYKQYLVKLFFFFKYAQQNSLCLWSQSHHLTLFAFLFSVPYGWLAEYIVFQHLSPIPFHILDYYSPFSSICTRRHSSVWFILAKMSWVTSQASRPGKDSIKRWTTSPHLAVFTWSQVIWMGPGLGFSSTKSCLNLCSSSLLK